MSGGVIVTSGLPHNIVLQLASSDIFGQIVTESESQVFDYNTIFRFQNAFLTCACFPDFKFSSCTQAHCFDCDILSNADKLC